MKRSAAVLAMLGAMTALSGHAWGQSKVTVIDSPPDPREAFLWRMPVRCLKAPSVSMLPTFPESYTFYGRRLAPEAIKRGDVIVFRVKNEIWIKRVAGLPGDVVQMREGVVVLNGQPVQQRANGAGPDQNGHATTRHLEQFPGESVPHAVLDRGKWVSDNTEALTVPANSFYVLGDNRDNSADSRFPEWGFSGRGGPVLFADVYGVADLDSLSPGPMCDITKLRR